MVTLWMLSILGIFSVSLGYQARQKATFADRIDRRNALYGLAEAGVHAAILKLKEDESEGYDSLAEPWAVNEQAFRHVSASGGTFSVSYETWDSKEDTSQERYGVQDEESKINLNTADPQTIARVFQSVGGLDEDEAEGIAYAIVDWRDTDVFLSNPTDGAEDDYYEDLDVPYGAKDRPFEVLQELLLVRGMTPELLDQVKGMVTIYGGGSVNINTAPAEVLSALGLDPSLVDKILAYRRGSDRLEATSDDQVFMQAQAITGNLSSVGSLSSSEVAAISNLVAAGSLGVASNHFMVRSRGELSDRNGALDLVAVVNREGKALFWSAAIPRRMSPAELESIQTYLAQQEEVSS